ncbi:TonB-dependent siderophore receptor [Solimonas fluminis]|uniref:TonB-dependent siderophore receptor n=1 Tax=Solimonas fluminis TaxID=2086571 RepID=A0A2S5TFI1_9GAMM|nr:TonB-dependent receptor [Solimonas fluminis]PPE73588.1 TonB-dependent siderophore receptor [Solimonas fluminis]
MHYRSLRPLLALGLLPLPLSSALAEEAAVPLPPVVVSGLPSPRPELEAPAAIGRVDAEDLAWTQPGIGLSESLVRVPGLTVRNRQNYAQDLQIQSRGFGARSSFGVRGIQLRLDGIPLTAPDGQGQPSSLSVTSLDHVEVLRGPLAYPYGNASGGVIAAFSAPPPAALSFGSRLVMGSDETWRASASAAGQALDGKLGYRIEGLRFMTDGYREHSAARRDQVAATASWQIDETRRLGLVFNSLSQPDAQDPLGLTRAQYEADPRQADAAATTFNTRKSLNDRIGGLRYEQQLAGGDSLELVAYGSSRAVQQFQSIPVSVQQTQPQNSGGVIDLEREGYGGDGRYNWKLPHGTLSAGLQFQSLKENRKGYENFVGATTGVLGALRRDEDNQVDSFDQFLSADWALSERWSVLGALRRSEVAFESDDHYVVGANIDDSGDKRYSATTPALALRYAWSAASSVYGSWGRGFETPTFTELSYKPDGSSGLNLGLRAARSQTFELGWKRALPRGGLFTLALFDTGAEDDIVPARNSGGRASFQNADTQRRGAEAGLALKLAGDWSLQLAADYIDAEFDEDFEYFAGGATNPVSKGNRVPGIARHNAWAELAWRRALPGWSAAVDVRHAGSIAVNDRNDDQTESYRVVNARLAWMRPHGRGSFGTFVRVDNLLDKTYAGSVIVNEGNNRFFEPAPDRSWFAGVEMNFTP